MAISSSIDYAERSADYWKRQLTLEETVHLFFWISLLNSCSYCVCVFTITLILLGKGWVYGREWHSGRHLFLVEHPQQHFLKLRKPMLRYFLLIQLCPALKISEAGFQDQFLISNRTHYYQTNGELLQQPEKHHRVGFIHTAIVLRQWSEAAKLSIFVSLNLPLEGTDIYLVEADLLLKSLRSQLVPAKISFVHFSELRKDTKTNLFSMRGKTIQKYEVEVIS